MKELFKNALIVVGVIVVAIIMAKWAMMEPLPIHPRALLLP